MTKILFDEGLDGREFGTRLFHVEDFLEWLKSKKLRISTKPKISEFEFVQVEALLCAIQNDVRKLTFEKAYDEVAETPRLSSDPAAEIAPAWLLAAEAPRQWRKDFVDAVSAGELQLLDRDSKRPIASAVPPEQTDDTQPAPDGVEAALVPGSGKRWTPEVLAEVAAYRVTHGTKATAEKYGVSTSLIRKQLPGEKPAQKGFGAFNSSRK